MFTALGGATGALANRTPQSNTEVAQINEKALFGCVVGLVLDHLVLITAVVVTILAFEGVIHGLSPAASWGLVGGTGALGTALLGLDLLIGRLIKNAKDGERIKAQTTASQPSSRLNQQEI